MATTFLKAQIPSVSLYSGLSASATSMVVTPLIKDLDGNVITMAALGSTPQCTVDPKVANYEEIIGFTGITNNGDGTMTLTGLSRDMASSNLATPGTGKQHGAGAIIVFSLNPQDVARVAALENDQTFTGTNTFTKAPVSITPVNPTDVAIKSYIDGIAIAGSPDATTTTKGITKMSVAPVSATAPIAVGQNDPKFVEYYADTGAADAYVITPVISIGAYAAGQRFSFKATNANTTAATLNVNGLGAKAIKKLSATALVANDILAGAIVVVEYDGTNFQMLSQIAAVPFSATLDTDGTLAANSDTKVASQKATKTYVDGQTAKYFATNLTHDMSSTTTTTIAHGLSRTPKFVRATMILNKTTALPYYSVGTFDGTNNQCIYAGYTGGGGTGDSGVAPGTNISGVAILYESNGADNAATNTWGVISVDGTNITITWTKHGSPTGTPNIMIEAFA